MNCIQVPRAPGHTAIEDFPQPRSWKPSPARDNNPVRLPAFEEVMEDLAASMQRLLEFRSGGRQRESRADRGTGISRDWLTILLICLRWQGACYGFTRFRSSVVKGNQIPSVWFTTLSTRTRKETQLFGDGGVAVGAGQTAAFRRLLCGDGQDPLAPHSGGCFGISRRSPRMTFDGCRFRRREPRRRSITCQRRSLFWRSKLLGVKRGPRGGTRCSRISRPKRYGESTRLSPGQRLVSPASLQATFKC